MFYFFVPIFSSYAFVSWTNFLCLQGFPSQLLPPFLTHDWLRPNLIYLKNWLSVEVDVSIFLPFRRFTWMTHCGKSWNTLDFHLTLELDGQYMSMENQGFDFFRENFLAPTLTPLFILLILTILGTTVGHRFNHLLWSVRSLSLQCVFTSI